MTLILFSFCDSKLVTLEKGKKNHIPSQGAESMISNHQTFIVCMCVIRIVLGTQFYTVTIVNCLC